MVKTKRTKSGVEEKLTELTAKVAELAKSKKSTATPEQLALYAVADEFKHFSREHTEMKAGLAALRAQVRTLVVGPTLLEALWSTFNTPFWKGAPVWEALDKMRNIRHV